MPELPELEIARRQLERWSAGRTIVAVPLPDPAVVRRSLSTKPSDAVADPLSAVAPLVGGRPSAVRRHGKRLAMIVGDHAVCAHFGMTGFFSRRPATEAPPAFARIGFTFDGGQGPVETVWLRDGRRFGCVHVVTSGAADAVLSVGQGPDLWDQPPTAASLRAALKGKKPVKPALMEQERLAGLGNIHAAEACFRARVHPSTPCADLGVDALERLAAGIRAQLAFAVQDGDTDGDVAYVNLGGPNPFAVYDREGQACGTCGAVITSAEQAGRTTYWCPGCQPLPAEGDAQRGSR